MKIFIIDPAMQQVSMEQIGQDLKSYLDLVSVLRQRVVPVPFSLHHPLIINHPGFDLNAHICRGALPAPGGIAQLDEMLAYLGSQPLDRSRPRPLREFWLPEGLANGPLAVVYKMLHYLADGAATMGYLSRVRAPTAQASPRGWIPEAVPSPLAHVQISDPVKRYQALRQQTLAGKQELAAFGKTTYGQLLEYMPPLIYKTMKKREYRTRAADHREQKGVVNLTVSNVPEPREVLCSSAGVVKSPHSVGVLSEGVGLNITAWSYVD